MKRTVRVLIVDDEPNVSWVLSNSLKKLGDEYIFETAHSGEDALTKIRQASYTLLITDYQMAGMTGLDLAQVVRQLSPATQVILMTAYGTDKLRDTTEYLKLDGYLDKPFTMDQIREIVKQVIVRTNTTKPEANRYRSGEHVVHQSIEEHLKSLRVHTDARCVLLLSSGGYSVNVVGQIANLDISGLSALVAANFMAAAELAKLLGSGSIFTSSYHEGNDYNIYAYKVTDELLLAVIFGSVSKPGVIWFYTKQTAMRLLPLMSDQSPKVSFTDNISAVLDTELDKLLSGEQDSKEISNRETGQSNRKLTPMSFEDAIAAGLVPPQIVNRELKS